MILIWILFFLISSGYSKTDRVEKRARFKNKKVFFKDNRLQKYLHYKKHSSKKTTKNNTDLIQASADLKLLVSFHPLIQFYNNKKMAFNRILMMRKTPEELKAIKDIVAHKISENKTNQKKNIEELNNRRKELMKSLSKIDGKINFQIKVLFEEHRAQLTEITDETEITKKWRDYKDQISLLKRNQILTKQRIRDNIQQLNDKLHKIEEEIFLPLYTSEIETREIFQKILKEIREIAEKIRKSQKWGAIQNISRIQSENYYMPISGNRKFLLERYLPETNRYNLYFTNFKKNETNMKETLAIYKEAGDFLVLNQSPEFYEYIKDSYLKLLCRMGFQESEEQINATMEIYTKLAEKYQVPMKTVEKIKTFLENNL